MKNLKVIAYSMVLEADLSESAKRQLFNFLRSATDPQIKLFVVEGRVGNVTKEEELKIDSFLQEVAPLAAYVASSVVFSMGLAVAAKIFNKFWGEAVRACAEEKGREKEICKKRYMITAYQQKISTLRREASKCNQTADPEKCQKPFLKAIEKTQKQLIKVRAKGI